MEIEALGIDGTYLVRPRAFPDDRGVFLEAFNQRVFQGAVGHPLRVAQVNCSVSRKGTVRGLHAIALPGGQARYMTCPQGAITDIVVDTRIGSPTFGRYVPVELSETNRHALYLAEGLSHGFAPLTEQATVVYLCSSTYVPGAAIQIHPLDPELSLPWPTDVPPVLSEKDQKAPSLDEAVASGILPSYDECKELYRSLRDEHAVVPVQGATL